jgi:sugar lactone lactonase YvrE
VVDGADPDPQSGRLLKVNDENLKTVANISAASLAWEAGFPNLNPDFPDANPYAVVATGHRIFVIDAAANTLNEVSRNGTVRVIAYFPKPDNGVSDAVPTCVAKGPDGALYVGTLAIAAGPGQAKVYRVDPDTKESVLDAGRHVWASGLGTINGCAFSPDGKSFYASEFIAFEQIHGPPQGPPPGDVVKIPFSNPNDPKSRTSLTNGALTFPGGVAVSPNGTVYVSNISNDPFNVNNNPAHLPLVPGQVVRLTSH